MAVQGSAGFIPEACDATTFPRNRRSSTGAQGLLFILVSSFQACLVFSDVTQCLELQRRLNRSPNRAKTPFFFVSLYSAVPALTCSVSTDVGAGGELLLIEEVSVNMIPQ